MATNLDTVVYVSYKCAHSHALLEYINNSGIEVGDVCYIEDVPVLPKWVVGTPTVIHKTDVYCGDAAFSFIESLNGRPKRPSFMDSGADVQGQGMYARVMPRVESRADETMTVDELLAQRMAERERVGQALKRK